MRRLLAVAVVAATVLIAVATGAEADHPAGWHWRRSANPADLLFIDSVTAAWQTPVERATKEWSRRSGVIDITLEKGKTSAQTRSNCRAPKGAVRICNADYGNTSWAAFTRVVVQGHHVVKAKIKLNDHGATAHRALACHEIGHALGLAHRRQDEPSSCLTPFVSASQMHPDAHDIQQLAAIYKHKDGTVLLPADAYDAQDVAGSHGHHDIRVVRRGELTVIHIRTLRAPPARFAR